MEKYFNMLKSCSLFDGISLDEINCVSTCLNFRYNKYPKNSIVLFDGDKPSGIGIVISGTLHIVKDDIMGNRNILTKVTSMELFGEAMVISNVERSLITVVASEKSEVLFFDVNSLFNICSKSCSFHIKLITNLLKITAQKNLELNLKIELLTMKTIREKILFYLSTQENLNNKGEFTIPYSRNQLAEFLCINRSSLSRELSNMKKEGLLIYKRNFFKLCK